MKFVIITCLGIGGGFFVGVYFGKNSPVQPGEWRQNVYLVVGIVLVIGAILAVSILAPY